MFRIVVGAVMEGFKAFVSSFSGELKWGWREYPDGWVRYVRLYKRLGTNSKSQALRVLFVHRRGEPIIPVTIPMKKPSTV
jgi:hypothetical protein